MATVAVEGVANDCEVVAVVVRVEAVVIVIVKLIVLDLRAASAEHVAADRIAGGTGHNNLGIELRWTEKDILPPAAD
jgi:hypothetical protein